MSVVSLTLSFALLEGLEWWMDVADPPIFSPHPDYGYLMQPNQTVATRGKRFRINNAGLRGVDIAMPKPQGVYRIAFLGDSITYGGGSIRDDELFVNRIVKSLDPITRPRLEAVNISAPGWGLANMAGFVNSVGLFDADLLVWVISAPDLRRPFCRLEEHRFLQKKPSSRVMYAIRASYYKILQAIQANKRRSSGLPQYSENLNGNISVLRRMLAQFTGKGLAVAVVLVPGVSGYDSRADVERYRDAAEDCAVPFLDLAAAFDQSQLRDSFIDDVHLSAKGHAVVAGAIGAFIGERFLLRRHASGAASVPPACMAE